MTHLSPTTNPNAARVDDDVDDEHTIVVPPEDRCLVVLDGLRTPAEASECHPGISRLARGLAELVDEQERRPRTPAEAYLLRGFEALLGVRTLRTPRKPTLASVAKQASKAAIPVARYEVKPDGTVVVVTGQGEQQQGNELDEWIAKHARAPERH